MITLDQINELRQNSEWTTIIEKAREHLTEKPDSDFVLRALVQALERQNQKNAEYETALLRLLDMRDRIPETTRKLADFYHERGENEEAVRNYESAIQFAVKDRQYKVVEDLWIDFLELAPHRIGFMVEMTDQIHEQKQSQKAINLLQMIIPEVEKREKWDDLVMIYKHLVNYNPEDESNRQAIVDTLRKKHSGSSDFERVIEHCGILKSRPIHEAIAELEDLLLFLPGRFVRHPDWGIGKVKDLDMLMGRVKINFQRKRDHTMALDLAKRALDQLPDSDFRVMAVTQKDKLQQLKEEEPVELIKVLLRSFGSEMNAKQIKEYLVPTVLPERHWSGWWQSTCSAMRKDAYLSLSGGSNKSVLLRDHALSEEDDLLARFDSTKAPHLKVDQIYEYLRTTRRSDINYQVIGHFSDKLKQLIPKRRSPAERIELWMVNEDLKNYSDEVESLPSDTIDQALSDGGQAVRVVQSLRFKGHQSRAVKRLADIHKETWPQIFKTLMLEPEVQVRNDLADALEENEQQAVINEVVETALSQYREYPHTFIWMAEKALTESKDWLTDKLPLPQITERLLLLIDFLTSQAKRREKDEAIWLRKVASDARELVRRGNYHLFKKSVAESDEAVAQSIYRRAQTNEGLDNRTSVDMITIVRARHPTIFQTTAETEDVAPEGLYCLASTLSLKKARLKKLVEQELPAVVEEIETARQHGDLRENAEYHAAKDKQKLLSSQTGELQDQLQQAKAIELSEVKSDSIQFGTFFRVKVLGADSVEEYTLLGPWESDPDHNVLSYMAPLARHFMGKTVGDEIEVELPNHTGKYEVISIDPLTPEQVRVIEERIDPELAKQPIYDNQDDDEEAAPQSANRVAPSEIQGA